MSFLSRLSKSKYILTILFLSIILSILKPLWVFYRGKGVYLELKSSWSSLSKKSPLFHTRSLEQLLIQKDRPGFFNLFPKWVGWELVNLGASGFILSHKTWLSRYFPKHLAFLDISNIQSVFETVQLPAKHPQVLQAFLKLFDESETWQNAYQVLLKGGIHCLTGRKSLGGCPTSLSIPPVWSPKFIGCVPVGYRQPLQLEVFESRYQKCIYWFELYSKAYEYPIHSKLYCLHQDFDQLISLPFDRVQAIVPDPASNALFHLYEGHYNTPRFRSVVLDKKLTYDRVSSESVIRHPLSFSLSHTSQTMKIPLPLGSYLVYRCTHLNQQTDTQLSQSWVYAPIEFAKHHRPDNPDLRFGVAFFTDKFEFHVVDQSKTIEIYPDLTLLPHINCVLASSVDARCGERVVRTAANLAWEWQNGFLKTSGISGDVWSNVLVMIHFFLSIVDRTLDQWSLSLQNKALLKFYSSYLSSKEKQLSDSLLHFLAKRNSVKNKTKYSKNVEDNLGFPSSFWASLQQIP